MDGTKDIMRCSWIMVFRMFSVATMSTVVQELHCSMRFLVSMLCVQFVVCVMIILGFVTVMRVWLMMLGTRVLIVLVVARFVKLSWTHECVWRIRLVFVSVVSWSLLAWDNLGTDEAYIYSQRFSGIPPLPLQDSVTLHLFLFFFFLGPRNYSYSPFKFDTQLFSRAYMLLNRCFSDSCWDFTFDSLWSLIKPDHATPTKMVLCSLSILSYCRSWTEFYFWQVWLASQYVQIVVIDY